MANFAPALQGAVPPLVPQFTGAVPPLLPQFTDKESEWVFGARTTRSSTMEDKMRKKCDVLQERFESFLKTFGSSDDKNIQQQKAKLEEEKKIFLEKYCYKYETGNLKDGSDALRGSAVVLVIGGLAALFLPAVSEAVSLGAIAASGVCSLISLVLAKKLKDEERGKKKRK